MSIESDKAVQEARASFTTPTSIGKVRCDKTGEVFNIEGLVDRGREFIISTVRAKARRDSNGGLIRDKVSGEVMVDVETTGLKTVSGSEFTRIN